MSDDAEHVVLTLPRGERGELRVARYRFKRTVGTKFQFWFPGDDDELKPGKCVTLRDDELGEVIGALQRIARKIGTPTRVTTNGDAGTAANVNSHNSGTQAHTHGRKPTHTTRKPFTIEEIDQQEIF